MLHQSQSIHFDVLKSRRHQGLGEEIFSFIRFSTHVILGNVKGDQCEVILTTAVMWKASGSVMIQFWWPFNKSFLQYCSCDLILGWCNTQVELLSALKKNVLLTTQPPVNNDTNRISNNGILHVRWDWARRRNTVPRVEACVEGVLLRLCQRLTLQSKWSEL